MTRKCYQSVDSIALLSYLKLKDFSTSREVIYLLGTVDFFQDFCFSKENMSRQNYQP